MYSVEQLSKGISNPRLAIREINSLYYTRFGQWEYNEAGVNFLEEDWDNLVLLDACRVDLLEECSSFDGAKQQTRISRGSDTFEFLWGNLHGNTYRDTVYVTASPVLHRRFEDNSIRSIETEFHDQIDVWQNNWADDAKTVMPEVVTDAALEAAEQYPNKRLLIHYLQPHAPFLGPTAEKHFTRDSLSADWSDRRSLPNETLWTAYKETLERALPHVEQLVSALHGKTVVSADHGQLFGERGRPIPISLYGHPRHQYLDPLVRVPWYIPPFDDRKRIVAGDREESKSAVDQSVVKNRLTDLGYR